MNQQNKIMVRGGRIKQKKNEERYKISLQL